MIILHLPSELGYEKVALASVAVVARRMGFSPDRIDDIKSAVAEACINAMEHGNGLNAFTPVVVELDERDNCLQVQISDSGRSRIPAVLPQPGARDCNRGWGLYLMQHLVDEFYIGQAPQGGNTICLRMRKSEQAHSQ